MATVEDVIQIAEDIRQYVIDLPTKLLVRAGQIVVYSGLSDISESLGTILAGEFRAGNRNEPGMFLRTAVAGSGFTGMRMAYPALTYDLDGTPTEFHLVGVNDDILQFGVNAEDGTLVAGGGAVVLDVDGITATAGEIAGWTINTDHLLSPGTPGIKIASTGSIETTNFVTGVGGVGWKISESGDAEFNNAVIRGELRTTVLTYQEVQAVSGTMGVFQSAGVLSADLVLPAVPSGTYTIWTKAPNSTNPKIFDHNHILQIKNGTQSTWFIIDGGYGTSGDGYSWLCTYLSGTTDVTYTIGQAVISYGVSGDGFLLMEAIGTGAPYFSVRTHAGAPYTATTEHVRMGNLNGGWGYATDIYGVAIGQYAAGKGNITVDPTDGIKINIYTDNIMQFNSSGAFITNVLNMTGDDAAIAIGATPPTSATAGTGLWLDKTGLYALNSNTQKAVLDDVGLQFGSVSGSFLSWLNDDGINLTPIEYTYGTDPYPTESPGSEISWINPVSAYVGTLPTVVKMYSSVATYEDNMYTNFNIDVTTTGETTALFRLNVTDFYPSSPTNPKTGARFELTNRYGSIYFTDNPSSMVYRNWGLQFGNDKSINVISSLTTLYNHYSWSPLFMGQNYVEVEYVSSTSIRITKGDYTHLLFRGVKLKISNPTYKYFVVTSSSYDSGTDKTTLVLTGDTVTSFTTNSFPVYYSHAAVANAMPFGSSTFIPLTTPLTSTSWDGDARSTTAKTLIDLSAVFGVPAGVKAVLCNCAIRDSASAANEIILILSPNNTNNQGGYIGAGGLANDKYGRGMLTVPCNSNGDIYYQIYASGAGTADVYLEIHGYWI